jgi:hypothetical protein
VNRVFGRHCSNIGIALGPGIPSSNVFRIDFPDQRTLLATSPDAYTLWSFRGKFRKLKRCGGRRRADLPISSASSASLSCSASCASLSRKDLPPRPPCSCSTCTARAQDWRWDDRDPRLRAGFVILWLRPAPNMRSGRARRGRAIGSYCRMKYDDHLPLSVSYSWARPPRRAGE